MLIKKLQTVIFLGIWFGTFSTSWGQTGHPLTPISGADGAFELVEIDGVPVYRSAGTPGAYSIYMYFQTAVEVMSETVYIEVVYKDLGSGNLGIQYNSTANDYEFAINQEATDLQNTQGKRVAFFELPAADFRNAQNLGADLRLFLSPTVRMHILSATLYFEPPPSKLTAAPSFGMDSHIVSTSVFHWYYPQAGQLSGPWRPVEGRENWTGQPDWWKSQIKQIMAANIDVLWVHLMNQSEDARANLFQALYELRIEGYDVPKVAPFLDPLITWYQQPNIDLATSAGKDSLAAQYLRFFNQYFRENPDRFADDYLAKIDGRPVLDTWHVHLNMDNVASLQRNDLESRLQAELSTSHPVFDNGIYMIGTAYSPQVFSFVDERTVQFELNDYFVSNTYNSLKTMQLKGGYWDQNVRNPGDFLARAGGAHFKEAWSKIDASVNRIYIESWNEYDEGTGIYAGNTGEPYIHPGSGNSNTDTWSSTNDPYEYIKTTAQGAADFNDAPEHSSKILNHTIPDSMHTGESLQVRFTVRNEGNAFWSGAGGFSFSQIVPDENGRFVQNDILVNDDFDDIPIFGGIFRGRPKTFFVNIKAPEVPGTYNTKWAMRQDGTGYFGDELQVTIHVSGTTAVTDHQNQSVSTEFALWPAYPNPFNPKTNIRYELPQESFVSLKIFDLRGRAVATLVQGRKIAGQHNIIFNGENFASGIYIYKLEARNQTAHRKFLLIK
ncbi:MAG: T9SS C-terminal target domain-containing protein [Calditrichaeota bacterium]|nr:MAG: T9SS C-terminal target domain-containing protein [Calditrichota bacterium]